MQFQFDVVTNPPANPVARPVGQAQAIIDLLSQILEQQRALLEVHREHLAFVRSVAQDSQTRWRNLLARWQNEFPDLGEACRVGYPMLEQAYVRLLNDATNELAELGDDGVTNDFATQEFLDRNGMRLSQLGQLMSVLGPLAEAAGASTETKS
jgi:hypothetical protein